MWLQYAFNPSTQRVETADLCELKASQGLHIQILSPKGGGGEDGGN